MKFVFSKYSNTEYSKCNLLDELIQLRQQRKDEDNLLLEIKNIIIRNKLKPNNILDHLDLYSQSQYLLDDEELDSNFIFTIEEIEKICIQYRMNFVDALYFKNEIPTIAEVKLEYLNDTFQKQIKYLKILSYPENFKAYKHPDNYGVLFAPTINGNYYLVHQWGRSVPKIRKYLYFPLRTFETLALSVIVFTLIIDLILPTHLITLDHTATYWSGYRLGVFFHLLIFFGGFTMFLVVGFFKNVTKNVWSCP